MGVGSLSGEEHPGSKLSVDQVRRIKQRLDDGDGLGEIADDFPISKSGVYHIKTGRSWSHVTY